MIRASVNIAETNDISVVAYVIRHNKTAGKKISIFVCTVVLFEYNMYLRLDILINEEVIIGFHRPHILHRYHTTTLLTMYRTDEAINSCDND